MIPNSDYNALKQALSESQARVKELEKVVSGSRYAHSLGICRAMAKHSQEEAARYREALEFYARQSNWEFEHYCDGEDACLCYLGIAANADIAQAALAPSSEESK